MMSNKTISYIILSCVVVFEVDWGHGFCMFIIIDDLLYLLILISMFIFNVVNMCLFYLFHY